MDASIINFMDIEKSVGKKGINQPLDVINIQNLLNHCTATFPGKVDLKPDGKCGPTTITQIGLFQKHIVQLLNPDSKVDPGGKTISQLKERVNGSYLLNQQMAVALNAKSTVDVTRYINLFKSQHPKATNLNYLERLVKSIYMDASINDIRWMAYMLATVQWECAGTWKPIEEFGKGKKHKYGNEIDVVDPSTNKIYKNAYFGRGYVQLTWADNYKKMGNELGIGDELYLHPDKALDHELAYKILSHGMRKGSFSNGNFLSRYINGSLKDFVGARRIINGTDKQDKIANLAEVHLKLLEAATFSRDYHLINPLLFRNFV